MPHRHNILGKIPFLVSQTSRGEYDPDALKERAQQWRDEAALATSGGMRTLCLSEANKYDLRLQKSLSTPVFRDTVSPAS